MSEECSDINGTEFLKKVISELRKNKTWDNGCENIGAVTELCAQIRELTDLDCHTDGRYITLETTAVVARHE